MNDHESVITKQLKEDRGRLQEEEWQKASLLDKMFGFLVLLAIVVIIASPIYLVVSLVRLYILK